MKKSRVDKPLRPAVAVFLKDTNKALKKYKIKGVKVFCSMNAEGQVFFSFDGDKSQFREAGYAIKTEMNPSGDLLFRHR